MFIKKNTFLSPKLLQCLENSLYFTPAITLLFSFAFIHQYVKTHNLFFLFFAFLIIYLLPLSLYRLMNLFFPLKTGSVMLVIGEPGYTPWMGALHLQQLYNHLPTLEKLLKLFPPSYHLWLRAWGSHIGKNCIIQANVDILDRTSLDMGDGTFIGHGTVISAHLVNKHSKGLFLIHRRVKLGKNVFLAGGTIIGPGVEMENETKTQLGQKLIFMEKIKKGNP